MIRGFSVASLLLAFTASFVGCTKPNLASASRQLDYESVMRLLQAGEHPDSSYSKGHTALYWADGYYPIMRALLDGGSDPNLAASDGKTPLVRLLERFQYLPRHIGEPTCENLRKSVALLIEKGADVNLSDANGYPPLYYQAVS